MKKRFITVKYIDETEKRIEMPWEDTLTEFYAWASSKIWELAKDPNAKTVYINDMYCDLEDYR